MLSTARSSPSLKISAFDQQARNGDDLCVVFLGGSLIQHVSDRYPELARFYRQSRQGARLRLAFPDGSPRLATFPEELLRLAEGVCWDRAIRFCEFLFVYLEPIGG